MTQPATTRPSSQPRSTSSPFDRLRRQVIEPGLCTHCGACVGLSSGQLTFERTLEGPIPVPVDQHPVELPEAAWLACPGKGLSYPELNQFVFGHPPKSWLAGVVRDCYVGYAGQPGVRRQGASGGVITQILLHLLETGKIDGAVVLRHGTPRPWLSSPIVATDSDEILAASQSVYVPTPVNSILDELTQFGGDVALVGLPDQVASLRRLQQLNHEAARKIKYLLGPYVGTAIHLAGIESYLRAQGVSDLSEVVELRYREGEWPGYLYVRLKDGKELRAPKFYYNYLIPFYITRASLLSIDFTNELADISVGDAWSPDLETEGGGHSVVLARSERGHELLEELSRSGKLTLERTPLREVLAMHGHMLDFKKRGAFLRMRGRALVGKPIPSYGVRPDRIPLSRIAVELVISGLFVAGRTRLARRVLEWIPIGIIGPLFDWLRQRWKELSKPTKRRGLWDQRFELVGPEAGGRLE